MAKVKTRLLTVLLVAYSVLGASSCATSQVPRPDTNICDINVKAMHLKCYNLKTDYDQSGTLLPTAKAHYMPCASAQPCTDPATHYASEHDMLQALDEYTGTDPDGWAGFKAYINDLKDADSGQCQGSAESSGS